MTDNERRAAHIFTFDAKDLEVLCESLWHSLQRADVPDEDIDVMRKLRERLNDSRVSPSRDGTVEELIRNLLVAWLNGWEPGENQDLIDLAEKASHNEA